MKAAIVAASLAIGLLVATGCSRTTSPAAEAQSLVTQAHQTIDSFRELKTPQGDLFRAQLADAQGVAIFPGTYRAGFIVGGEYGTGVLLARRADGWSPPAFYSMGAGSVGLQIGGQVSETVIVVRTQKALQAMVKHQGTFGADLGITVGTAGAGLEGATTANLGADVVVFSTATGLYAGGSLEGSVLARRNDYNEAYYGAGAVPDDILFGQTFSNPQADGLRRALAAN